MKEKLIELFQKYIAIDGIRFGVINVSNSFYKEMKSLFKEVLVDRTIAIDFDYNNEKHQVLFMNNDFIKDGTVGVSVEGLKELKTIEL